MVRNNAPNSREVLRTRIVGGLSRFLVGALSVFAVHTKLVASTEVLDIWPTPNYPLTADKNDASQLVDGSIVRFPSWTKQASVAWKDSSFIQIALRTSNIPTECRKVMVIVHAGQKPRAGVYVPRRLDFYSGDSRGELSHVGQNMVGHALDSNAGTQQLRTTLELRGRMLVLAIHAGGRYTAIDEISLEGGEQCSSKQEHNGSLHLAEVRNDSTYRLKAALVKRHALPAPRDAPLRAVTLPPYSNKLQGEEAAELEGRSRDVFTGGTLAHGLIRVSGGCDASQYRVSYRVDPNAAITLAFYKVEPVLSFSGSVRYDPLTPLTQAEIQCAKDTATFIWIAFESPSRRPLEATVSLNIEGAGGQAVSVVYNFHKVRPPDSPVATCCPRAVSWGYTIDQPIWQDGTAALRMMERAGINIHVVPPQILPPIVSPKLPTPLSVRKAVREMEMVERAIPDVQFLLFARFDQVISEAEDKGSDAKLEYLAKWAIRLASSLQSHGIPTSRWYLYPVDEPTSDDIALLLRIAEAVRSSDPTIRLYANPIDTRSQNISRAQLESLRKMFDKLQLNRPLAERFVTWLANNDAWYFENPRSPPKDAPPMFYRSLGIRAWLLNAKGVGFWSFSDTSSTSAWDDFDGRRPDWAVVYEGAEGPRSSRRWEAFARGLQDYESLCRNFNSAVRPKPSVSYGDLTGFVDDWLARHAEPAD